MIIETWGDAEPLHTPGIVVYQHGPFAWQDAHDAVHNAVVMGRSGENGVDCAQY
ncbi:hypothetical protein ACNKHN_24625 [Shigella flexneri]